MCRRHWQEDQDQDDGVSTKKDEEWGTAGWIKVCRQAENNL